MKKRRRITPESLVKDAMKKLRAIKYQNVPGSKEAAWAQCEIIVRELVRAALRGERRGK